MHGSCFLVLLLLADLCQKNISPKYCSFLAWSSKSIFCLLFGWHNSTDILPSNRKMIKTFFSFAFQKIREFLRIFCFKLKIAVTLSFFNILRSSPCKHPQFHKKLGDIGDQEVTYLFSRFM